MNALPSRREPRLRGLFLTTLSVCLLVTLATLSAADAKQKGGTTATTVRGGFINEAGFIPAGEPTPGPDPGSFVIPFTGGSTWNGSFTGHTVINGVATLYSNGALEGTFTETFYGVYEPDRRTGSLTHSGTFSSDEHSLFTARSRIVGGTCGFLDSSGSLAFDGASTNGGYIGTWRQPKGFTAPPEPCTP